MKQFMIFIVTCFGFLSCNTEPKPDTSKTDSAVVKEAIVYPFTPKYSLNWQPGDERNALLVLNCLKNYVAGDIRGAMADFADTATFIADKFHFSGSKDSLASILGGMRSEMFSVSKVFDTWITTFYPDKNDTWVTLWYTEKWADKKGKMDSLYYMDDVLIKNGKIVEYDEKQRRFPDAKK
jgi:hypothetical protein